MITLIGTGHIFNLSQVLLKIFEEKQPDILCVELDEQRYNALMFKQNDPEKYKEYSRNLPFLYKILARFQENMAAEYGVQPGEEMITTINYAQSHQLPLAFIDMNAQYLFIRMLKSMGFHEKIRMLFSGLASFFVSKKRVEKELRKLEDDFDKYIDEISEKFPTVKRVLVDERNQYMVQQLIGLNEQYKKIVAVVGDGHIPGISTLLNEKNVEFESIRLSELRKHGDIVSDASTASFSIEHRID